MNRFQMANLVRKTPKGGKTEIRQKDFDSGFHPYDVLDLIVGSCQEFSVSRCLMTCTVEFIRRAEPVPEGVRTYVTNERAGQYRKGEDGLFYAVKRPLPGLDEQPWVQGVEALTDGRVKAFADAMEGVEFRDGSKECAEVARIYQAICGRCGCVTSGIVQGKRACAYGCGATVDLS